MSNTDNDDDNAQSSPKPRIPTMYHLRLMLVDWLLHFLRNHGSGGVADITQNGRTEHALGHFVVGVSFDGESDFHLHVSEFGDDGDKSFRNNWGRG